MGNVTKVFLKQAQRLVDHAKGFPAVKKSYLANTVAIIIVLGDPRWKVCFPQASSEKYKDEYSLNNEAIFLCSLGAAIQNIQLGVAAEGLASAWLSGGGEDNTNSELSKLLGFPNWMKAYGTIPIGYPAKHRIKGIGVLWRNVFIGTSIKQNNIVLIVKLIFMKVHSSLLQCTETLKTLNTGKTLKKN